MSDELEQIRKARMEELRAKSGAAAPARQGGQPAAPEDAQQEMRTSLMSQILEVAARERLSRIEMVRPERARQVEELLIRMAQSGQLRGKVSEPQLVQLLDQISAQEDKSRAKVVYNRRDSDDDDYYGLKDSTPQSQATSGSNRNVSQEPDSDDDFFD